MQIGIRNHLLPIQSENTDQFFSEVVPALKKAVHVDISEQVSEEIVEFPLVAKLYLEADENAIVGKLEYHYGSYEIDPFNGLYKEDLIIICDSELEIIIHNFN